MELCVVPDPDQVGQVAARRIAQLVAPLARPVLGVATGSSPLTTYQHLAELVHRGELDLGDAEVFALDEYVGIDPSDPNSYTATIHRTVTEPLRLSPQRVHVPDGGADDLALAGRRYERLIRGAGGVDVQLLGIGGNGHIGFNEPGTDPTARTHVVELSEQTRHDNARFFAGVDEVPTRALTQGLGTILDAEHLVLVAEGAGKAEAVAAALRGPVGPDCPASLLQRHPSVFVVLDEAAAGRLG